jgi:hypothetical protein
MSDRLAISASLSVLMMSVYVLFGSDAVRVPFGPEAVSAHHAPVVPGLSDTSVHLMVSSH